MAEVRSVRTIGDPVVAAAPAGVRIRARIQATAAEAAALAVIGEPLGSVYRGELAERIRRVLRPGQLAPVEGADNGGRSLRRRGYRNAAERFAKTRRLAVLRDRVAAAEDALANGRPSITVGGKRLWRNGNHLDATDMTEQQWRERWDAARMFLTADGVPARWPGEGSDHHPA